MKYKTKDNYIFYPQIYKSLISIANILSPLLCSSNIKNNIKNYECLFDIHPEVNEWISFYDNEYSILKKIHYVLIDCFKDQKYFVSLISFHILHYETISASDEKFDKSTFEALSDENKVIFLSIMHNSQLILPYIDKNNLIYYEEKIQVYNINLESDIKLICEKILYKNSEIEIKDLLQSEILFFIRVVVKCFIQHKDFSSNMIKKARNGSVDDIVNLLTIDKSIIFDPAISKQIHKLYVSNDYIFADIQKAYASNPSFLSAEIRKYLLIALQCKISKLYNKIGFPKLPISTILKKFKNLFPNFYDLDEDSMKRRIKRILNK